MVDLKLLNLEKYKSNSQYIQYLNALNEFLEKHLPKIKYTHVFLTGSFVKGKLHSGSDLDLDIINSDTKKLSVKKIKINGIIIEYATFSFKLIRDILDEKVKCNRPDLLKYAVSPILLADDVSNWKMLVGNKFPAKLVNKAKKFIK